MVTSSVDDYHGWSAPVDDAYWAAAWIEDLGASRAVGFRDIGSLELCRSGRLGCRGRGGACEEASEHEAASKREKRAATTKKLLHCQCPPVLVCHAMVPSGRVIVTLPSFATARTAQ